MHPIAGYPVPMQSMPQSAWIRNTKTNTRSVHCFSGERGTNSRCRKSAYISAVLNII